MSRYNHGLITLTDKKMKEIFKDCRSLYDKLPCDDIDTTWNFDYGYDNYCGYFLQLFPVCANSKAICDEHGAAECWDIDGQTITGALYGSELGYFLKIYNGNPYHIQQCFLDLEF